MAQYVGQHYVVRGHGRHRASGVPRIAGPALLAASGAVAAAAVAAAALGGNDPADGSAQASHDGRGLSAYATDDGADSSAQGSTGEAGQRVATAAAAEATPG